MPATLPHTASTGWIESVFAVLTNHNLCDMFYTSTEMFVYEFLLRVSQNLGHYQSKQYLYPKFSVKNKCHPRRLRGGYLLEKFQLYSTSFKNPVFPEPGFPVKVHTPDGNFSGESVTAPIFSELPDALRYRNPYVLQNSIREIPGQNPSFHDHG